MQNTQDLTAEEKEFFALVQEAIFANPFGKERAGLDAKIAGACCTPPAPYSIESTVQAVREHIALLDRRQTGRIDRFSGKSRDLVESAFLFDFFYVYRKKFDDHVREQSLAEDRRVKLSFAAEGIAELARRGFDQEGITRAFELAWQFRRAFHFIRDSLIGRSPAMQRLRHDIWNILFTHDVRLYERYLLNRMEDFSTLLLGETGTGKGAVAAAIGRSGFIAFNAKKHHFEESFTDNFLSINLSQFSETLIESELFGHKKGAFTGAFENHVGVLERVGPHGVILLDEIGEMAPSIQIKLLQVLQDRVFYPVGSRKKVAFRGRVLAATNRPISALRKSGSFRDDFYYRLCSDVIALPSLRERLREDPDELGDLLQFIVIHIVGKPSPELVHKIREIITATLGENYPWPGNVRELEQCVRRILLKGIYEGDSRPAPGDLQARLFAGIESGELSAQQLLSGYCALLYSRSGTYEDVARRTNLDRRTAHKYIKERVEEE